MLAQMSECRLTASTVIAATSTQSGNAPGVTHARTKHLVLGDLHFDCSCAPPRVRIVMMRLLTVSHSHKSRSGVLHVVRLWTIWSSRHLTERDMSKTWYVARDESITLLCNTLRRCAISWIVRQDKSWACQASRSVRQRPLEKLA